MKWLIAPNKENNLIMHREDEEMTIRIYPDRRLSPFFKAKSPIFIMRGDEFVELDPEPTTEIEFHIFYYNKETENRLKEALANNGLSDQDLKYVTVSNHSDKNGIYITVYKEFAWLKFNSIISVIESLDENGKNSLLAAREYLMDKVPVYQPSSLRTQALRTVQKEIDKGNTVIEEAAKKSLPLDIKEHLTFREDRILKVYTRFIQAINEGDGKEGFLQPIHFAKSYILDVEKLDLSSKYLPIMKEMFKERFKIDYDKACLTDASTNPDPPKDKGGNTPGCNIM